jgi:hypothetical protein
MVHSKEFNDVLDIVPEPISYPWEIFANRSLLDLEDPDLHHGRAFYLYPEGYHSKQNEMDMIACKCVPCRG